MMLAVRSHEISLIFLQNENLVSVNAQLRAQLKIATGDQSQELASAIQREQDALEELKQTKDSILTLERELLARKQVIDAGNDTIIVKVRGHIHSEGERAHS